MERFNGYVDARKAEGVDIVTVRQDAAGSQSLQDDEVAEMIENGCDVICVNLVDRTAPTTIIDMARKNDVPIIFFNRELVEEDLMQWDSLYYVGADAFQSGVLQGEMATEYCKAHPETDRNGDGSIQYVVLEGEAGHQDSIIRTEYSVDTMIQKGILLDKVGYAIANWNRVQARSKMEQLIDSSESEIELVLANNDDMAMGAIEAYEGREIPRENWPVIFGIDGTEVGLQAVISGKMAGTVYNDKDGQAQAMEALAYALASGKSLQYLKLPDAVTFEDNKYIRLPYKKVDRETAEEILSK
jgi:methyl-galactoside transport system substrate-binding protein